MWGDTPLRVCLAFGLRAHNDTDWIYRRVAQAAARRGIGLKQNGHSERFDTWDSHTNVSYLYERYRRMPGINLALETGGQIHENTIGAMGHPLSLLNRALVAGADNLYLYDPDIAARHVSKYFHYANEQWGRPLFTRFYCRLGGHIPACRLRRCEDRIPRHLARAEALAGGADGVRDSSRREMRADHHGIARHRL